MKRVIVVGPGAAGKTTLAARLAEITGLPVIELDRLFWQSGLAATPPGEWAAIQRTLAARAVRRSRERADFWTWLLTYRRHSRPALRRAVAAHAGHLDVYVLRTPRAVRRFVTTIASAGPSQPCRPTL